MSTIRYVYPEQFKGSIVHTKKGPIEINENTSQKDLKYLKEEYGMKEIMQGEKAMTIDEEIKVMEKDLEALKALKAKKAKQGKSK